MLKYIQESEFIMSNLRNPDFWVIFCIVLFLLIFGILLIFAGKKVARINALKAGLIPYQDILGKVVEIKVGEMRDVHLYWNLYEQKLSLSKYSKQAVLKNGCLWWFYLEAVDPLTNKIRKYKGIEYDISFKDSDYKNYIDNILKLGDKVVVRVSLKNKRDYVMDAMNKKWEEIQKNGFGPEEEE